MDTFVKNFQEHPQTIILTDSMAQVLQRLHPDGQYGFDDRTIKVTKFEQRPIALHQYN